MLHMLCRAADNTLAETINGLFKAEVIHRRGPWRNYEAVECHARMGQLRRCRRNPWFNNCRLLELIENIAPAEAEANFHAALERADLAAWQKQISLQ